MKLTDFVYTIASRYRGIENFIRHPVQILGQRVRRAAQNKLEEVEIPTFRDRMSQSEKEPRLHDVLVNQQWNEGSKPATSKSHQVETQHNYGEVGVAEKPVALTDIPLLSEQEEIRGRWGRYRRVGEVQHILSHKRYYNGKLVLNDRPVLIQEYLLPEYEFNSREARDRKEKFALLTGLNLRQGDGQDFRLVTPWDAIASTHANDSRCYLITEPINNSVSLRNFLMMNQAPMSALQVRQVLNQVLQTLWFLHNQRVRLPTGEVMPGLAHGNLSLDSLLIVQNPQLLSNESQFLIYVTDLALWEHLFAPPNRQHPNPTFAQDLVNLGQIADQLLAGFEASSDDGRLSQSQQFSHDRALNQFIQDLIGGRFRNDAEEARNTLLQLPILEISDADPADTQFNENNAIAWWKKANLWRNLVVLSLLAGSVGGLLWLSWRLFSASSPAWMTSDRTDICCLANISDVTSRQVKYTVQKGIWQDVLQGQSVVTFGGTLEQELQRRDPRLKRYLPQVVAGDALAEVQAGRADFALTEWQDNLPPGFIQQEVAFDGLAVVVAYSDAKRVQSIPEAFQGKISYEQLRQLYGSVPGWQPPGSLQEWKTKRYLSNDLKAVKLFQQQVLDGKSFYPEVKKTSSNQMFGEILKTFETDQVLGIGLVRLSKVFEQCSVYPLAIAVSNQAVQPFVQDNGQPITPDTDLCNDKGSYWPNPDVFRSKPGSWRPTYPLAYRLVVVHHETSKVGERFAMALQTEEGQALLAAAGLVPLKPLNR